MERYERSDCRSSRHTRTNPAFVQAGEDAALRTLKFRFESGGLDQDFLEGGQSCPQPAFSRLWPLKRAVVAERQRRPIVYRDQKGSTPFHRASFLRGAKLIRMSRRLLTVRQSVRFARHPPVLFWGSKAAMRPAVNRETRRFESCPQSHFLHAGQLRWSRRLVLQTSTVEFDPQARHQFSRVSGERRLGGEAPDF